MLGDIRVIHVKEKRYSEYRELHVTYRIRHPVQCIVFLFFFVGFTTESQHSN